MLLNCINLNSLYQYVNINTRNSNILDIILSHNNNNIYEIKSTSPLEYIIV